ncbi:uncharacterized protein LOC119836756 [Zerene cesonia]|uniref:uncharacterized protein LOC119836756 n=1 Tax=Zerene cesonia TaxID=33412 RepID=UPI0018E549FB|nr:uncharacterized protein LOC119836756 [Zerene cesonia]
MLSRREKLLQQPWDERRYKDHRSKVKSALPAIDDRAPPARPHVALKLKKVQKELDRKVKIQNDNFSLLQRLNAIMKVNRLDNHWAKPLPNFQHKVGQFYDVQSLNSRLATRYASSICDSYHANAVKCFACEYKKINQTKRYSIGESSLPSIHFSQ